VIQLRYLLSFLLMCVALAPQSAHAQWSFSISNGSGASISTAGTSSDVSSGYAMIQPEPGGNPPAGLAIFGFRQNGVLVTEAGLSPSSALSSGRLYVETVKPVETGLAIANPNDVATTISFYFTDLDGVRSNEGTFVIPPRQKIAVFLNEAPFSINSNFRGSLTFDASAPVAAVSFRGYINTRGEFLTTTLPVFDLTAAPRMEPTILPNFADGGGWSTQLVLLNLGKTTLQGTVQFRDQSGTPANVTTSESTNSEFAYSIPPGSAATFQTNGTPQSVTSGSIRVTPAAGTAAPRGVAILSMTQNGVRFTEAASRDTRPSTAFRMYAELSGDFASPGPIQSAIAIANPSENSAVVTIELTNLDGSFTGLIRTLDVPPRGQTTKFLNEFLGFAASDLPFQGVARITSSVPISVAGLRGRYNERREFLMTTTQPVDETAPPPAGPLYFPHIVDSGGYSTQFVLFGRSSDQVSSGSLQTFSVSGNALSVVLGGNPALAYSSLTAGPHPLVARYDVESQENGEVFVEFGTDTTYTRRTATYPIKAGETVRILVAGMKPETAHHMRAKLMVAGNVRWTDVDHVFTTSPLGKIPLPTIKVTRSTSLFLQESPGVELIAIAPPAAKSTLEAFVTDRDGNPLWFYSNYNAPTLPQFLKLMPNGHMLVALAVDRSAPKTIREIDLEGTTIRQLTTTTLAARIKAFGATSNFDEFSHDFIPLPNGHLIVLGQNSKAVLVNGAIAGTQITRTLQGEVIVDLDANWNPTWVWSSFDYLDPNRALFGYPDWTHGNAIVLAPDGDLLLSMRHQGWVVKIDFDHGSGSGSVLWRLGKDGDFTLTNGGLPDWFYAQHYPTIVSSNGPLMTLAVFDNGNGRLGNDGKSCGNSFPSCYTRATVFEIDQDAKSARLLWAAKQDAFSTFGGALQVLPNGNIEIGMSQAFPPPTTGSRIREMAYSTQVIWQMDLLGGAAYRAYRIPSLYPDITWP
jgi:arylsulfate sulfotransferase